MTIATKFTKTAYFYKARWNKEDPFIYITSRRYTERLERTTPIKVYSNVDAVTLTVMVWFMVKLKNNNFVEFECKNSNSSPIIPKLNIKLSLGGRLYDTYRESNDIGKSNLLYTLRILLDESLSEADLEPADSDFFPSLIYLK